MRALLLTLFLGQPPELCGLRWDKQGVLADDILFPDAGTATTFSEQESWDSQFPEADMVAAFTEEEGLFEEGQETESCGNVGDEHSSLEDYLATKYLTCTKNLTFGRNNKTFSMSLPRASFEELTERFARPELAYSPYMTALPVFYVSQGGVKEHCFFTFLGNFSPSLHRIEAVMIGDNYTDQLRPFVEDPSSLRTNYHFWKNHSGLREWRKRWGCLLSHLVAIRTAYQKGLTAAIILEDDAVPLYSAWHSPIEDLLMSLPQKWEAVQLQWTGDPNVTAPMKGGEGKLYTGGSGWGSAAYVIHRRGMERLLKVLYNHTTGKLKLRPLVSRCHKISADDCLLGFSSSNVKNWYALGGWWYPQMNSTTGETKGTRPLQAVSKATPPRFLHDSKSNKLHERNMCLDIELAGNVSVNYTVPKSAAKDGVLLFLPVGVSLSTKARSVLQDNLYHAAKRGHDVFLAFEEKLPGRAVEASARKLQLLRQHWQTFGAQWAEKYAYVWAVDEDINLTHVSVGEMVEQAQGTGAIVVTPCVKDRSYRRALLARKFIDHHRCRYRYTNYIDMLAPMMAPAAWAHLFNELGQNSTFESMDQIWCNLMQSSGLWRNQTQHVNASACAIVDALCVLHDDDEEDPLFGSVYEAKMESIANISERYGSLLVETGIRGRGKSELTSTCVT